MIQLAERFIRALKTEGIVIAITKSLRYFKLAIMRNLACDIKCELPQSTILPHPTGIVLGSSCELGENIIIRQNVTIGGIGGGDRTGKKPTIKDNVEIGAGACILGDISIGKNAVIGANSVVINDVSDNVTVAGAPAKQISKSRKRTI